ncbi:hypothetical protein Clacol_000076 [Clathrus columnatus]|uniref:Uncharacterized protein n=1 Tax=Clathrus columnatus TaxID=1419009 RepID=A0AAV4ZZR5_9AGAM|nr:hypothetical protein Clacol_000076 [Clathrus columnatus]
MAVVLLITFLAPIGLEIYLLLDILTFTRDILTILLDLLAFIGVIHQVWGLWRLKRSVGLRSNDSKDIVTLLLQQGIVRFCFVLTITTVTTALALAQQNSIANAIFDPFQQVVAVLLICDFTIALRERNMKTSTLNQSALSLPTFRLASQTQTQSTPIHTQRSMSRRLSESIIAEMGEINNLVDVEIDSLHLGESDSVDDLQDEFHTVA